MARKRSKSDEPPRERRAFPREAPIPPVDSAEAAAVASTPVAPPVPHMAESEQVTEAEFVTVNTPNGKSTVIVERAPGHATHATIVDEKPKCAASAAPPPPPPALPPAAQPTAKSAAEQKEKRTEAQRRRGKSSMTRRADSCPPPPPVPPRAPADESNQS